MTSVRCRGGSREDSIGRVRTAVPYKRLEWPETNLSTRTGDGSRERDSFENHSKVHPHFTPTYSSWLNHVELWFAKIDFRYGPQKKPLALHSSLQQEATNVKWKYILPSRRTTPESAVTVHRPGLQCE
jgi:hypothetical protein